MRAEQQTELLRTLKDKKLGTQDIEEHFRKQVQTRKVSKNKRREVKLIVKSMESKYKDANQSEHKAKKKKATARKKMENSLGKNSSKLKNAVKKLKKETAVEREAIKLKNKQKVEHLERKYVKKDEKVPEELQKYMEAAIFTDAEIKTFSEGRIAVYGDVAMSNDENELLKLGPKFNTFTELNEENFSTDREVCFTKYRWDVMSKCEGDDEMTEEEKEQEELFSAEARQIYDPEGKTINLAKQKATDVKHNARVVLPKAMKPTDEAMVEVKRAEWTLVWNDYFSKECDERGRQQSNLTPAQKRGLKNLLKRVKDGEIVVCQTDKSGKLSIMSMEAYMEAGSVHTSKDREVNLSFVEEKQKECNGHCSMLMKVFRIGEDWKHSGRHRETRINKSCNIPPLRLLVKDHKVWDPSKGPPQTRPVCSSNVGQNVHLSDIVSDVLEPVATARKTMEIISVEDWLSQVDAHNAKVDSTTGAKEDLWEGGNTTTTTRMPAAKEELKDEGNTTTTTRMPTAKEGLKDENCTTRIDAAKESAPCQEQGDMIVIGADAVTLYPSIRAKMAGKAVYNAVVESSLEFEMVDDKEAARYIALNLTSAQVRVHPLRRVLPWRNKKTGTRPIITGPAPMGPEAGEEEQWCFPRVSLTKVERRKLVAEVMRIAVETVFATHLYQFGGRYFHQADGGPIGLRATGAIAKIVMGDWDLKLLKIMMENDVSIEVAARYVDDIRLLLASLKMGWRWNGKQLEFKEIWLEEDRQEGLTKTARTANVLNSVMNSIHPELKFTMETCEDFESGKLPTLDTQIWMEGKKLMYEFYEKPMSAKTVIRRNSALSENTKVASLSQDLIRRMKNTSLDLPIAARVQIVDEFSSKLLTSGYSREQIKKIAIAGLKGFEKAVRSHKEGKRTLHRSAHEGAAGRNRKKLLERSNWFKGKKRSEEEVDEEISRPFPPTKNSQRWGSRKVGGNSIKACTVLFVDQTPGGELAARLREKENDLAEITGWKAKIVEKGGTSLQQLLVKSNPWEGGVCGRNGCEPC